MKNKQLIKSISLSIFSVTCCCLTAFMLFSTKMATMFTYIMALLLIPITIAHVKTMKSDDEARKAKEIKSLVILGIAVTIILAVVIIIKCL